MISNFSNTMTIKKALQNVYNSFYFKEYLLKANELLVLNVLA